MQFLHVLVALVNNSLDARASRDRKGRGGRELGTERSGGSEETDFTRQKTALEVSGENRKTLQGAVRLPESREEPAREANKGKT